MQYQSECLSALKSVVNIQKPFEKTFMDTMKLFMAIPDRINFLQLGRYGCFSEQTYRNLFETPWIGYFWSGCAGDYKRGLEILDNMDKNLVDWYSSYLISRKDKLQNLSRTVVADAFFSKETFITPMCENDLFACLGLAQTRKLLTNFSKNSFYLLPEPLRRGEFLTNY